MSAYQFSEAGGPRNPALERVAEDTLDGSSDRRSSTAGSHRGSVSGHPSSRAGSPPRSSGPGSSEAGTSSKGTSSKGAGSKGATGGELKKEKTPAQLVGMRVDLGADAYLLVSLGF